MTRVNVINVLITGMGPYPDGRGGRIDENTSYLITTLLPKTLEPNTMQNPSSTRINVHTVPHPVKTEYKYVRDFCKDLHNKHADDVDLFIHLGEARGWDFLTIERVAYKQGMSSVWWGPQEENEYYKIVDDAGMTVDDIGPCPWDHVPMGLRTALNVDTVAEKANAILEAQYLFTKPGGSAYPIHQNEETAFPTGQEPRHFRTPIRVQPHDEGGPFLCGFIHYESLAGRYIRKLTPNVLFCHMPGEADADNLKRTSDGILAIVVSAANELRK